MNKNWSCERQNWGRNNSGLGGKRALLLALLLVVCAPHAEARTPEWLRGKLTKLLTNT